MATLNIVNKSPFEKLSLQQCLQRITEGGSVLLIEDAVVAATIDTATTSIAARAGKSISIFVLAPDLNARGFSVEQVLPDIEAVDYAGFVQLVADHQRVHSWL